MNELDLTRHLNDFAATVDSPPDSDGLRRGLLRIDRNRRIRNVGAAGSMVAVLVFGYMAFGRSEPPTRELDVRGESPAPAPADPDLIPGSVEEADRQSGRADRADRSQDEPITESDRDAPSVPEHLQVSSTSVPLDPTSSSPPPTTLPTTTLPVTTEPPPPTNAPSTTIPAVSFSANSRYGSCEEDPPYDEYSGTATPGATITITSPWSATTQTTADDQGHWYLRVEFPSAPVGQTFTVSAGDGSTSVDLAFVRTA